MGNPLIGIEIGFVQEDITTVLAAVDADEDYEFTIEVAIPDDAVPGHAAFTTTPPSFLVLAEFTVLGPATAPAPIDAAPTFTG